jgi:hypothetical protein
VESGSSVVYNGYCKILRVDRRIRLKVLNFYGGAGIGKNLERAKVKDEEIKAVLDGAGISYTVISPWETDRVLLDLKIK